MQNIWPISCHSDVSLNMARLIFAIINWAPFYMCKHIIMTMIEMQEDNQIALPFGGLTMPSFTGSRHRMIQLL